MKLPAFLLSLGVFLEFSLKKDLNPSVGVFTQGCLTSSQKEIFFRLFFLVEKLKQLLRGFLVFIKVFASIASSGSEEQSSQLVVRVLVNLSLLSKL